MGKEWLFSVSCVTSPAPAKYTDVQKCKSSALNEHFMDFAWYNAVIKEHQVFPRCQLTFFFTVSNENHLDC